jgi:hypothetical protein
MREKIPQNYVCVCVCVCVVDFTTLAVFRVIKSDANFAWHFIIIIIIIIIINKACPITQKQHYML